MQVLAAAEYLGVTDTEFCSLWYGISYADFGIMPRVYSSVHFHSIACSVLDKLLAKFRIKMGNVCMTRKKKNQNREDWEEANVWGHKYELLC